MWWEVTPKQMRAARMMLNWSQATLAQRARISCNSVRRIEQGASTMTSTYTRAYDALCTGGIVFLAATDTVGPGVRMKAGDIPFLKSLLDNDR